MNRPFLEQYRDKEQTIGSEITERLLNEDHTILNSRAVYPEYELKEPFGIHRPGVNIALLIFFYRQVIAYVPPMKKSQFKHRFGIRYKTFLQLAYPDEGIPRFVFPVLNHPRRYLAPDIRSELSEILIHMPPTWERWHSALYETGGDQWFHESDKRFNYPSMWSIPELRKSWGSKLQTRSKAFVSREIKQQIRNNYTDLCLVGRHDQANEIASLSYSDPELAVNDLFYSSDLYAYPLVMGAGGTANIRAIQASPIVKNRPLDGIKKLLPSAEYFDSDVLQALLEGLRFDSIPNEFRVDFLLAWHKSDNAQRAREAYQSLLGCAKVKSPSLDELHSTMKAILNELNEFCRNAEPSTDQALKIAQGKQNIVSGIATVGGIACSITGLFMLDVLMALTGLAFSWIGIRKWSSRERIIEGLLKRHAPDVSPELYLHYRGLREFSEEFFRRIQGTAKAIEEQSPTGISTMPVRTIWWSD